MRQRYVKNYLEFIAIKMPVQSMPGATLALWREKLFAQYGFDSCRIWYLAETGTTTGSDLTGATRQRKYVRR